MENVFILLFNADKDNVALHTLKIADPEQSGRSLDVVLAFEVEDDAARFALLLEAQDFPTLTVEKIPHLEIEEFCQDNGYELRYIPIGVLTIPPPANLEQTDWQPDRPSEAVDHAAAADPDMPTDELDAIRRQLERLL